jgi:serine protease Do
MSNSQIEYNILRTDFFVISNSQGSTRSYTRYHAIDGGILGFTVAWGPAENIYGERLATIMSDLFRAIVSLALDRGPPLTPLNYPQSVAASRPEGVTHQAPSQPPVQAPATQSSGTGLYVSPKGHLITSAHVIENCRQIIVSQSGVRPIPVRVISKDMANDLALLKTDAPAPAHAQFRSAVRLGEGIAVFGFPLSGLLATSGNFTIGNIAALAGPHDDTRIIQISAPVQPGNSGGPVLDQSGNVTGIVLAKLNALKLAAITEDLAQNINFGIKSSVAISFVEANGVPVETTEPRAELAPADLADKAKSFAVFVECQR